MTIWGCLLVAVTVLVGLPVLAYLVVKLGTVGYYRGRAQGEELGRKAKKPTKITWPGRAIEPPKSSANN